MMNSYKVSAIDCKCDECDHGWISIEAEPPSVCPACQTAAWNDLGPSLPRQMKALFKEYEHTRLVSRLRRGRVAKKAQTGRCEGNKPYGHTEAEREQIACMRSLRDGGMMMAQIALAMAARGYKARGGGAWHRGSVAKILART